MVDLPGALNIWVLLWAQLELILVPVGGEEPKRAASLRLSCGSCPEWLFQTLTQNPNPGKCAKLRAKLDVPPQPFSVTRSCDFLGSCEDRDWSCEDLRSSSSSVNLSPAQDPCEMLISSLLYHCKQQQGWDRAE